MIFKIKGSFLIINPYTLVKNFTHADAQVMG